MTLTEKINKRAVRIVYDADGTLKGGDVAQVVEVYRDGVKIAETPEELVPIAGTVQQGIAAPDVLSDVQQEAIAATNKMRDERDAARTERDAKCAECDELRKQLDAAKVRIAELSSPVVIKA